MWPCYAPRQLLQSSGLCTMGGALPLAIGAKRAAPDVPVVCFTGDAGLEMVLGELATARDLKTPVIVVVFVDASLALIEMKQRGAKLKNVGVDFDETNFAALADAMGGHGVTVDNRIDLASALKAALRRDRFTVIAARIPRKSYDGRL
jgi:acetolactate synthase-1/2/3 large subunit